MNAEDLQKIIGAKEDAAEYAPVAMLLRTGYACFGHYNKKLNDDLNSTLVILNAQLMDLRAESQRSRPAAEDFREFLLEIVGAYESGEAAKIQTRDDLGKPVPLVAIPVDEIAIVYPVAQIVAMLQQLDTKDRSLPTLFDLDKSEILSVLRFKLW